ncbi:MAG: BMP family ABC transporter substrate-binding protein [Thermomicrobiales bacterium]|nr:BMP family ABC transporter substrate-binding protein [Thermomicrobiales bacterium]
MVNGRVSRRTFVGASIAAPALATMPFAMGGVAAQDGIVATMVTDTAGLGDQNFNDATNAGGQVAAEEFGAEWKVIESIDAAAYVPNLTAAAEQGQLVVATGFLLTAAVESVGAQFPDVYFTLIDSFVDLPNVQSVLFNEHQAAFLTGVAAGLTTATNKLGIIGGERIPPVIRYEVGFRAGVAAVNPDAEVLVAYVDSFGDPETGKEFALAQYNDGADIVFPIAGLTGIGGYQAVAELNNPGEQWILGADISQEHLAPGFELAVCRKGVDTSAYRAVKQVVEGSFGAGLNQLGLGDAPVGFDNPDVGVGFEDPNGRVADDVKAVVADYQAQIAASTLVVPANDEEFESHMAGTPVPAPAG